MAHRGAGATPWAVRLHMVTGALRVSARGERILEATRKFEES
jgi:hypothetical protein